MTETDKIEMLVSTVERRRDRLKHRADELQFGPSYTCDSRALDREKCLAQVEILEWVLTELKGF